MRLIDADALKEKIGREETWRIQLCKWIDFQPTVCDAFEQIRDEIAKCIHDKPHDEFEQGVNIGLEDAIDIIDKYKKGE